MLVSMTFYRIDSLLSLFTGAKSQSIALYLSVCLFVHGIWSMVIAGICVGMPKQLLIILGIRQSAKFSINNKGRAGQVILTYSKFGEYFEILFTG